jgi:hypothetical protein
MTDAVHGSPSNPLFRYPSISLGEAVEKIRTLYQQIHRRRMSREEIAKNLGYTTLNGASTSVISNLTRYGLLAGRQDGVGLSSDGIIIAIEEDTNSPDRQAAIRRAAFTPEIFKQLSEDFGIDAVPAESSVRIRLEKHGFPRKQAEAASRAFCETMALVMAEGGAYNPSQATPEEGDKGGSMQTDIPAAAPQGAPARHAAAPSVPAPSFLASTDLPPVTFPLPRGNAIEIRFRSKISSAEFARLTPVLTGLLQMAIVEDEEESE